MRILAISQKVFIELLRDKRTLLLLFAVPIFIMWLMNAAFSASTETDVTIAVVGVSENITKSLDDVQHITARDFQSQDSAQDALEKEKVDAILSFSYWMNRRSESTQLCGVRFGKNFINSRRLGSVS